MAVKGIGTIRIPAIINGEVKEFELNNIRYILSIEFNLLSTTQLDMSKYTYNRGNGEKAFYDIAGNKILQGYLHDRTYYLNTKWTSPSRALRLKSLVPAMNNTSLMQWYKRFGHVSMEATKAIMRASGIDLAVAERTTKS